MQVQSSPKTGPAQSKLVLELATAEIRAGNTLEARRLLNERLVKAPNDASAAAKLSEIALLGKRVEEATVLLRRAAVADPTPHRRLALITHLQSHVGAAAALKEIEASPPRFRGLFDIRAIEAAVCGTLGMHDRQIETYEAMAREQPGNFRLWMTLGNAYKTVGRFDDAVAALRKGIKARPTFGEAYWTLANFKAFRFTDTDIAAMRKALRGKLDDADALHFNFALGKAYEDRGSYRLSFKHYDEGNRIRAKGIPREQMRTTGFVNSAIELCRPVFFERRIGLGNPSPDPIFVVGLHRSGSTLIEQILSSHPQIEGTTELPIMQLFWDRLVRQAAAAGRNAFQEVALMPPDAIKSLGAEYLDRARAYRLTDRPFFVDKQPPNWMHLGLIRVMLPNAKIIDARRHPMACGFSNFKQNYATGVSFSYSLEAIGHFYRDYWRFMRHFDEVQPGAAHRVLNEKLIEDPEGEVRRLLDFVGVPFDPVCLEFHRNTRAVRTPSAEQVRRPINADGVDSWKPYETWLGPLKQALGPALDHWNEDQSNIPVSTGG